MACNMLETVLNVGDWNSKQDQQGSYFQRVYIPEGRKGKETGNQIIFSIVVSGNEIESKGAQCSYGGERVWDE